MKRQKKIYYVAGIISGIFVPILFLYFAIPTYNKLSLRVLDIGLPYKLKKGEKESDFFHTTIPTNGWKYKTVNVNNNFSKNSEDYFVKQINNLKEKNIDKTGIKFQFSDKNTYSDFVRLLNILQKTKQEMYGLDTEKTNSLYVLYLKPKPEIENYLANDVIISQYKDQNDYDYQHSSFFEKFIKHSPKESYYLFFGFLTLVYCAMLKPTLKLKI